MIGLVIQEWANKKVILAKPAQKKSIFLMLIGYWNCIGNLMCCSSLLSKGDRLFV